MTKKKVEEAVTPEAVTPEVEASAAPKKAFDLTLPVLKQIYEYIRDKDPKGGEGLTVEYKDKRPTFTLDMITPAFAASVMIPEIQKFSDVQIDVSPMTPGKAIGVVLALNFDTDDFVALLADNNSLEQLRVDLGPELGYAIARGLSDYLLELQGKS